MSTFFYIKLRETPGIKGQRGEYGESGQMGSNGTCIISPKCGITNCRNLIEKELEKNIEEYKDIKNKVQSSIMLNSEEKRILNKLNSYIDVLLPVCESGDMSKSEFINHIKNSL